MDEMWTGRKADAAIGFLVVLMLTSGWIIETVATWLR